MDLPLLYHELTIWIGDGTGLSDTILHIHAGLAVLMVARVATGRSLATLIPLAFVVAAEGANELLDFLHYGWRPSDTYVDIANTLFWPLAISLGVRWRPLPVAAPRPTLRPETEQPDGPSLDPR